MGGGKGGEHLGIEVLKTPRMVLTQLSQRSFILTDHLFMFLLINHPPCPAHTRDNPTIAPPRLSLNGGLRFVAGRWGMMG